MSKTKNSHVQVMTCGAACAYTDGSLHATTSVDKMISAVKTVFARKRF